MNWVLEAVITGITSFAATNLDDLVILTLLFARVSPTFRGEHIVAGQYLGFLLLVLASLPGFLFGLWIPKTWLGLLGILPILIGLNQLIQAEAPEETVQEISTSLPTRQRSGTWQSYVSRFLSPPTYQIAAITFANGGDNIGIYVPLFANSNLAGLSVILTVFLILIAVWCGTAYHLTQYSLFRKYLAHYGHKVVPFVLIGLGIFIFVESGSYQLFHLSH